MKNFPRLIELILSSSTEDYIGLYEVIWEINSVYPERSSAERVAAARYAVDTLLSRGWIDVYRCEDVLAKESEFERVDPAENERVLSEQKNWEPFKAEHPSYWITSTDEGDREYFSKSDSE